MHTLTHSTHRRTRCVCGPAPTHFQDADGGYEQWVQKVRGSALIKGGVSEANFELFNVKLAISDDARHVQLREVLKLIVDALRKRRRKEMGTLHRFVTVHASNDTQLRPPTPARTCSRAALSAAISARILFWASISNSSRVLTGFAA